MTESTCRKFPLIVAALILPCTALGATKQETKLEWKLWPQGAPGETGTVGPEQVLPHRGGRPVMRITNVTEPTIRLHAAAAERANGCAILVCPGGGYNILAYDLEGTEVAEWLNAIGVTAIVLKYRVPRRDPAAPHTAPLQDAQRGLRLVRQHARQWNIDPQRLGILGFSAGGNLAVMAATHWDETTYQAVDAADKLSCRPDFLVPIYPAYLFDPADKTRLSPLVRVTRETPPTFLAITHDDKDRSVYAALFYVALKRAGVPAELHVYARGGHGYGLRPSQDAVSGWPASCERWLRASGLLDEGSRE